MFAILQMITLLYSYDKKFKNIFVNLKIDLKNVLYWFQVNLLKEKPGKFQFMILGDKKNTFVLNIYDKEIKNSSEFELLGIAIDIQRKLKKDIDNIWRKDTKNTQFLNSGER